MLMTRDLPFGRRIAIYTVGMRRRFPFLPYVEVRQSVAVGLLETTSADSVAAESRAVDRAVYRLARDLGWHRIKDRQPNGRIFKIWVREGTMIRRVASRHGHPVRPVTQRT